MGPPGAGKGTQAKLVAERFPRPGDLHRDMFRANIAGAPSSAIEAKRYMDAGDYVPDEVTNAMVRDRLAGPTPGCGFLLDGYPRTLAQVEALDAMLADTAPLDAVLELPSTPTSWSPGCSSAPTSRAGPTTPRMSSGGARRSTRIRPRR